MNVSFTRSGIMNTLVTFDGMSHLFFSLESKSFAIQAYVRVKEILVYERCDNV